MGVQRIDVCAGIGAVEGFTTERAAATEAIVAAEACVEINVPNRELVRGKDHRCIGPIRKLVDVQSAGHGIASKGPVAPTSVKLCFWAGLVACAVV